MSRTILALPVAILLAVPLAGQETVNDTVIAQIKTEGFQRSAVMDTLSWLSDVHGPRLTGTPALRQAGEWARDQLDALGPGARGARTVRHRLAAAGCSSASRLR